MRSNDLCLDLVSSFLSLLFLLNTSSIFSCIGVRPDFGDDLGRFSSDLLKETYGKIQKFRTIEIKKLMKENVAFKADNLPLDSPILSSP